MKRTRTTILIVSITAIATVATVSAEHDELAELHASMAAKYLEAEATLSEGQHLYAESATQLLAMAAHHIRTARELRKSGELAELEESMAEAFARHYRRGKSALESDSLNEAVVEFTVAAIASPNDYRGYYARAEAHWRLARQAQYSDPTRFRWEVNEAIIDLQRVLASELDDMPIVLAVYHAIVDMHDQLGDFMAAEAACRDALVLDPSDEIAQRRLIEVNAKRAQ